MNRLYEKHKINREWKSNPQEYELKERRLQSPAGFLKE
jgi:hypothetical protein